MAACRVEGTTLIAQAGLTLKAAAWTAARAGLAGLAFAEGIPGTLGGGASMNAGAYGGEMQQVVAAVEAVDAQGELRTLEADALDYDYRHSALLAEGWVVTAVTCALIPGDAQGLAGEMRELAARRREKQPLQWPSAGSTFKRPPGHFAARLIEEAGLKGERAGGAQVSELHAGFIINTGDATAADLLTLIARVQARVQAYSGVRLEPEVRIVGED
jgi:UDP-N-acetylmuramate dehydrogenase